MTPRNEENPSSNPQPSGPKASTAFDRTRTHDALPSGYIAPTVRYGTTTEYRLRVGGSPKNPIGFAPPADPPPPRVFRTEVSFTRHVDVVRAGGSPGSFDARPNVAWSTPQSRPTVEASSAAPPKEGHLPFYKREISFRRKRATSSDAPVVEQEQTSVDEEPAVVVQPELAGEDLPGPEMRAAEPVMEDEPVAVGPAPEAADDSTESPAENLQESPEVSAEHESADADHGTVDDTSSDPSSSEETVAAELDRAATAADAAPRPIVVSETPSKPDKNGKSRRRRGSKGRRIVGLKVGATQLAAAVVAETDEGRELLQLARRPLEPGIVVDGDVRDREALTSALKSFFQEEGLPRQDVRLGVGSNRIGVRIFDIVGVEDGTRFDNAVRFKAHEVLPVAVHESALDYRVLSERLTEDGQVSRRVLLVVAPRDQIDPLLAVAGRAGLGVIGVDLEALGLLRAFVEPVPSGTSTINDTATVIVAIGHESSTLLVASDGVCEFTRVFDWGGNVLNEAIAQELDVPTAEAATILRRLSLSGPGRQLDGLADEARASAVSVVRNRLTPFARELVNSLQFYQSQPDSLGIGGVVITGGTSHLEGLDEALNGLIGVGVTVGDPLTRVLVRHELDAGMEAVMGSLAVPIGLAIDDARIRGVDLSTRGVAKSRSRRSTLAAVGVPIAAAVPLIALGGLYFGAHGTASSRSAELAEVQGEIAALPKPTGPTIDPSLAGSEAQRAMGVANILGGRVAWERMFREVSRIIPENVWLDTMTAISPADVSPAVAAEAGAVPAGAAAPATDVTLTGATFSQVDVARLLARLATLPTLDNVRLVSASTQETKDGQKTVQFNIVASLNSTGGAS